MSIEVDASDVIKLISQFLKEHSLLNTLRALQEESQVHLNTVDDVDKFTSDIIHGRWDAVLEVVATLSLPSQKLYDLFEQIVIELTELRELDTARAILRTTPAMLKMKKEIPDRYLRLEHLLQRTYFDYAEAYQGGTNKDRQRQKIAQALKKEVQVVPPSRLLALITQALKWQQYRGLLPKGSRYDLFRGAAPAEVIEEEKFFAKNYRVIKFGKKSHAECARFSPDGQYLVSGSTDGFVEVWDFDTGKLCKDLKYQKEEDFLMHDHAVHAVSFSLDGELLASGDSSGMIKVWRLQTGVCVRKFPSAHTKAVSWLEFAKDGTQLLSASHDNTVRIHGLKSGKTLKEFRGHGAFVTSAIYSEDGQQIISSSADGSVKVWDAKTTECIKTFTPTPGPPLTVLGAIPLPKHPDRLVVASRAPTLRVTATNGQVIQTYTTTSGDVAAFTPSPKGNYIYAVAADAVLYAFASETGKLEHALKLHKKDIIGIAHHPHRNILASYSHDGTLKIWKP